MKRGRIIKLGKGHYRITHAPPGPLTRRNLVVEEEEQKPGVSYCSKCNRQLYRNNKRGLCRDCAPHRSIKEVQARKQDLSKQE